MILTLKILLFRGFGISLRQNKATMKEHFLDVAYARIVDGVLQVTPDIEEEIAAVERVPIRMQR